MGSYAKNHVAIFVPEGREYLVEKLVAALAGKQGPFDFTRIIEGGPPEGGLPRFASEDLAGRVSDVDEHYGYSEMGMATMIEWTFEVKWYAPPEVGERLASYVSELGLGLRWHVASDSQMIWNPVRSEYEDQWTQIQDVIPGEITETMRALGPAIDIDFTQESPAP